MSAIELAGSITVDAPGPALAAAIGGPQGLSVWLADEAWSEKRPGGRVVLRWNDGRQAVGRWAEHAVPVRLALVARFDDRHGWARLDFDLRESGGSTTIEARLATDTQEDIEPWAVLWRHALEDIKTFAETGRNGRYSRRPMLGVDLEEVNEEMAASRALPVASGILVTRVAADSGAANAGIREHDILVRLGESPLSGWASMAAALDRHVAGEEVSVRLWRDGVEHTLVVALSSRDEPSGPSAPDAIRAAMAGNVARMTARLAEIAGSVSEAQSEYRPAQDEWSVKQVLAHLSESERWFGEEVARVAADEPSLGWAPGTHEIRARSLAAMPLDHLVRRLATDLGEAEARGAMLLAEHPTPPLIAQLGHASVWSPEHFDEHMAQIDANVKAALAAVVA